TGLGLSISKAIIEKLGGSLNFVSKPKEGTTFYFDLPIQTTNPSFIETTQDHSPDTIKLLICEDDPDQAKYLSTLLETAGLPCDIAQSVAEANKLLSHNQYRALLLDLI